MNTVFVKCTSTACRNQRLFRFEHLFATTRITNSEKKKIIILLAIKADLLLLWNFNTKNQCDENRHIPVRKPQSIFWHWKMKVTIWFGGIFSRNKCCAFFIATNVMVSFVTFFTLCGSIIFIAINTFVLFGICYHIYGIGLEKSRNSFLIFTSLFAITKIKFLKNNYYILFFKNNINWQKYW